MGVHYFKGSPCLLLAEWTLPFRAGRGTSGLKERGRDKCAAGRRFFLYHTLERLIVSCIHGNLEAVFICSVLATDLGKQENRNPLLQDPENKERALSDTFVCCLSSTPGKRWTPAFHSLQLDSIIHLGALKELKNKVPNLISRLQSTALQSLCKQNFHWIRLKQLQCIIKIATVPVH